MKLLHDPGTNRNPTEGDRWGQRGTGGDRGRHSHLVGLKLASAPGLIPRDGNRSKPTHTLQRLHYQQGVMRLRSEQDWKRETERLLRKRPRGGGGLR